MLADTFLKGQSVAPQPVINALTSLTSLLKPRPLGSPVPTAVDDVTVYVD